MISSLRLRLAYQQPLPPPAPPARFPAGCRSWAWRGPCSWSCPASSTRCTARHGPVADDDRQRATDRGHLDPPGRRGGRVRTGPRRLRIRHAGHLFDHAAAGGVNYARTISIYTTPGTESATLHAIATGLPASYHAESGPGAILALNADAGDYVAITGAAPIPGEIQIRATTGCRPLADGQ